MSERREAYHLLARINELNNYINGYMADTRPELEHELDAVLAAADRLKAILDGR